MSLTERGKQLRRDTITLSHANGGYHYGGCFSCVEILAALYDNVMDFGQDKFILSKGHSCWPLYVILREMGLDPTLTGHPSRDPHNGIHATTGSLGHGLPVAIGMALAKKLKGEEGTIFVLLGDGECQEGTTWESILVAAHLKLNNLVVIVDWNHIQGSGRVNDILPTRPLYDTAAMAGWECNRTDGHNPLGLTNLFQTLQQSRLIQKPKFVMAETVKGKGVSFMENDPQWHACWLAGDKLAQAMEELQ